MLLGTLHLPVVCGILVDLAIEAFQADPPFLLADISNLRWQFPVPMHFRQGGIHGDVDCEIF
jgi:hypothetical protein